MDRRLGVRRFGRRFGSAFLDSDHGIQSHDARRVRVDLSVRVPPPVGVDTAADCRAPLFFGIESTQKKPSLLFMFNGSTPSTVHSNETGNSRRNCRRGE
jgi:hypothetical protein